MAPGEHGFSKFEHGKPSVRAVCTCDFTTSSSKDRAAAMTKLKRHIEQAANRQAELDAWVQKQVDKAPPLSDDQRAGLAVLLRVSSSTGRAPDS